MNKKKKKHFNKAIHKKKLLNNLSLRDMNEEFNDVETQLMEFKK